jgi:RHS repeat-associated protein
MITDKNKNITAIVYNHLNLPTKITFGSTGSITYIYNAIGQKVEKYLHTSSQGYIPVISYYCGAFQYIFRENYADYITKLQFITTSEGYVKHTAGVYSYVFNYTDHLGNVRLSYEKDATTGLLKILEESNYYPFGLKHSPSAVVNAQPSYKYKYQGQERQDELGLNWDSFKWRNYDYAIGRFMSIDPLAEKYSYNSTYAFQENKIGIGRELEGLEVIAFDQLRMYFSAVGAALTAKTSEAKANLKTSIGNRLSATATGQETSNVSVGGNNINKIRDVATIAISLNTIEKEVVNTTKQVTRDGADAIETTGDGMVIMAPLTGPAAPIVAGVGGGLSTAGTLTNIGLDVIEDDFESAATRVGKEVITGGMSTLAKNAPGVDEKTSQLIDAHIAVYDNVVVPKIQEKK